jgi:hypothetical protein
LGNNDKATVSQRQPIPESALLARGRNWLSGGSSPIVKAFRNCGNSACRQRRFFWPAWLRKDEGIRLQGHWYCGPECFEHAAQSAFFRLLPGAEEGPKKRHRIPIGLLLLSRGTINDDQLKRALHLQREKGGGKIGKFLREIQAASEQDITEGLAAQWGCPVYPLGKARDFLQCASLLPLTLLEDGRMLPVHYLRLQQTLYMAFVEGVDRTALYAVEQMLHLRTVPCIVSESDLLGALDSFRPLTGPPTAVFESPNEPLEMARTTRSYAWQVGATDVWAARSGRYIWIRMQTPREHKDILFQSLSEVQ